MIAEKNPALGYRFDDLYLDVRNRKLSRNGTVLALSSKYFDVLHLLVRHGSQLVEKQRIFDEVWNGVIVTDSALTQCIKDIRKVLNDDPGNPRYIKTVPKHGYVFIGTAVAIHDEVSQILNLAAPEPQSHHQLVPRPTRPYKFLDYYSEQDASLFFGRATEIEIISSKILAHRCFILHGRSGVGKSSILRAGVMPRLKAQGHLVAVIRCFTDPIEQMLLATSPDTRPKVEIGKTAVVDRLVEHISRIPDNHAVTFLFDQFEEFFSLLPESDRRRFVTGIAELCAREALPLHLVFAIREDVLAEMSQLKSAIPDIFHNEYRLLRLSREQAASAMIEPPQKVGCHFEVQLAERILNDLGADTGIDPPQLQIVCDHLYDARDGNGRMTLACYERLGTASQILASYLERVLQRFKAVDLQAAREILSGLISADEQRLVPKLSRAVQTTASHCEEQRLLTVLEELVTARVVRRRQQDGETWLELAHDFLVPEVSRWVNTEAADLKRARGVLERAVENYHAHQLLIDVEALDLLLPFGERLGLNDEESDLLCASALYRVRDIPPWLARTAPSAPRLVEEASRHDHPGVRRGAVSVCQALRKTELKEVLSRLALWDESMTVRRAAGIALAEWTGALTEKVFAEPAAGENAGVMRCAVSLALVRDHEKRLAPLEWRRFIVSVLVLSGLCWVRLRRGFSEIVRVSLGGTLGGVLSGLVGGLLLGLGLMFARDATPLASISLMLVLVSLGVIFGALGAFAVSLGMITAAHITYRHSRLWISAGAVAGGALIGGVTNLLGIDTVWAMFGQNLSGLTGAFEGAVLGAGTSFGAVLAGYSDAEAGRWRPVLGAAAGATLAGILLTVIGGNLFSGSLAIVARSFADSQLRMDPLASLFGEIHFGRTSQITMGAIEGGLFGGSVMAGMKLASRGR